MNYISKKSSLTLSFWLLSLTLLSCGMSTDPERRSRRTGADGLLTTVMVDLHGIAKIGKIEDHPMNGYHLRLKKLDPNCATTPDIDEVHAWFQGKIVRTTASHCEWAIALRVGTLSEDGKTLTDVYFESTGNSKTGEVGQLVQVSDLLGKSLVKLRMRLGITDKGWEVGYGKLLSEYKNTDDESEPTVQDTDAGTGTDTSTDTSDDYSTGEDSGWIDVGVDVEPETPTASSDLVVYRDDKKIGVTYPTYWVHDSEPLKVRKNGSYKNLQGDYVDLWLAKELSKTFEILSQPPFNLKGVTHMGTYSYRKVAGSSKRSRHSYALAMDISGFELQDGTQITVEKNWKSGRYKKLLRDIRDQFCLRFDVVLSPDYNAAHYNHFHVDLNPKKRAYRELDVPRWSDLEGKPSYFGLFDPQLATGTQLTGGGDDIAHEHDEGSLSLTSNRNLGTAGRSCR